MIRVWYHKNCTDGFCCAWIARKYFLNGYLTKDVEYIPVTYGQKVPGYNPKDHVYILDFSFPKEELLQIRDTVHKLVVIDHHLSTPKLSWIIHDNEKAGCRLCWTYFFPGTKVPELVRYVEDADLYKFVLPYSKVVNSRIRVEPFEFRAWDKINIRTLSTGGFVEEGYVVEKLRNKLIDEILENKHYITLPNGVKYSAVANNCSLLTSDLGHKLAMISDPAVVYSMQNNNKVLISLRSINENVAELAKLFGGGGHKHAAGFLWNLQEFAIAQQDMKIEEKEGEYFVK